MRRIDFDIYARLAERDATLAVVGLGYVGAPLAFGFARRFGVVGYDIDPLRVELLRRRQEREFDGALAGEGSLRLTASPDALSGVAFYVVAVPTPVDAAKAPDFEPLDRATRMIAGKLKPGDYVVYESTVYPGCMEERCIPLLERLSGLAAGSGFKVGYSPERINPGDPFHSLANTVKVVSACDEAALRAVSRVYGEVVEAGVYEAPDMRVAEAAKLLENIQRDVNIALMNECALLFPRMGAEFREVLAAATTKWNFAAYEPGLVGGHCIGVDPYYLLAKAGELGEALPVIGTCRGVNETMPCRIARVLTDRLRAKGRELRECRALLMGFTYKENVSDIRNTKSEELYCALSESGMRVDVVDPYADGEEVRRMYGVTLAGHPEPPYDLVAVAVAHDVYGRLDEAWFRALTVEDALLADLKALYRGKIRELDYWSL